jgi:CoA binding protein
MKPDHISGAEPAHDIFRLRQPLDVFFAALTVAVIGATETAGSVRRTVLRNLIGSPFGVTVSPVNTKRSNVLGIKSCPNIAAVLVKGAIIISAGFKGAPKAKPSSDKPSSKRGAARLGSSDPIAWV